MTQFINFPKEIIIKIVSYMIEPNYYYYYYDCYYLLFQVKNFANTHRNLLFLKDYDYIMLGLDKYGYEIVTRKLNSGWHYGSSMNGMRIFFNFYHNNEEETVYLDDEIKNKVRSSKYNFFASSYAYYQDGKKQEKSLREDILSNRTEYYINDIFIGYHPDEEYINAMKQVNREIYTEKAENHLYRFLMYGDVSSLIVTKSINWINLS